MAALQPHSPLQPACSSPARAATMLCSCVFLQATLGYAGPLLGLLPLIALLLLLLCQPSRSPHFSLAASRA